MAETIVEWFGNEHGSDCGYCKSQGTNLSHGMWAHCMSCETYENLLNRGWRRSGMYCYKPVMDKTCCPQYTIRCDTTQVKLSKSQKKVLKRVNKFLISGVKPITKNDEKSITMINVSKDIDFKQHVHVKCASNLCNAAKVSQNVNDTESQNEAKENPPSSSNREKTVAGADSNKPKCRKAKEIRRENKLRKVGKKSDVNNPPFVNYQNGNKEKSIEDFIDELPSEVVHKLEFSLINVKDKDLFDATLEEEFELYRKYQHVIHW